MHLHLYFHVIKRYPIAVGSQKTHFYARYKRGLSVSLVDASISSSVWKLPEKRKTSFSLNASCVFILELGVQEQVQTLESVTPL